MKSKTAIIAILGLATALSIAEVYDLSQKEEKTTKTTLNAAYAEIKKEPVKRQAKIEYCADIPLSADLQKFLRAEAERNGVPYVLALAVCEQESRFDLNADGGDSYGLMQINVCHGPKEIIIEPRENIRIGCWLLGYLYREYRDWNKVLVAYNCGEAGAEQMYFRHGSISSPYSREVMFRSERFATLLGEESVLRPR